MVYLIFKLENISFLEVLVSDAGMLGDPFAVSLPEGLALVDGRLDLHAQIHLSCVVEEDG